jgi:uncharacterized protein (TIGR00375 family)
MPSDLFRADLHIHSRHSRATSRDLSPLNLAAWAMVKGLDVVASGDFTHAGWLAELEEALEEDDSGLLKPRQPVDIAAQIPWLDGTFAPSRVRFMLSAEISTIYKRGGKVRKIHHLVYVPGFEQAKALNARLAQIGNLKSDGRPILGLDSRHLLEMVLETHPKAFLIPAHIWTPWFSLFGSKSGFDSIEECYGALASEIFALETGLSSDPDMNWHWSALDRFRMVSNSDAHSGEKLAREANLFRGQPGYEGIYRALRNEGLSHAFLGSVEFFPEEGKYHLDGHRKCDVVLTPRESLAHGNICPVCGHPLTLGVLHRVMALADRETPCKPAQQPGFASLVPLAELLSEIVGTGPATKRVRREYAKLVAEYGSELNILSQLPLDALSRQQPVLAESMRRMRQGLVHSQPGYDGAFGKITMFSPAERQELRHGKAFFVPQSMPECVARAETSSKPDTSPGLDQAPSLDPTVAFNTEQQHALRSGPHPVLVLAGPGTGKTRTLLGRIEHLLAQGEHPRRMLVVTFTRRAARELRDRLLALHGEREALPRADTLHAMGHEFWTGMQGQPPVLLSEEAAKRVFASANPELSAARVKQIWSRLSRAREVRIIPEEVSEYAARFARQKQDWNLVDFTDLLEFWLEQVQTRELPQPYTHILVDEVQDLSLLQWQLLQALAPTDGSGFWAIGDPLQSIYGFRGAVADMAAAMKTCWPSLEIVSLRRNYRSTRNLISMAHSLFPDEPSLSAAMTQEGRIALFQAPNAQREAVWISEQARALLGGTAHWEADRDGGGLLSPGDVAVLVRIKALIAPVVQALHRLGLPAAAPENEPFWKEPRVAALLQAGAGIVGMGRPDEDNSLQCPERIIVQGPVAMAVHLQDMPPFDRLFWQGPDFVRLKKAFAQHNGWAGLLTWISFQSELELVRSRSEKIQVMTLHAAKGLEFDTVFLPALEDGLLPMIGLDVLTGASHGRDFKTDEAEERRLFYVGLTRAKKRLFLSHAEQRTLFGRSLRLKPSRFLEALPATSMQRSTAVPRHIRREKRISLL